MSIEPSDILSVGAQSVALLLKTSLPVMVIAMVVGIVISLIQALTQIQEMTLSFVPKIIAIFLSIMIFLPFIGDLFLSFSLTIFTMIQRV